MPVAISDQEIEDSFRDAYTPRSPEEARLFARLDEICDSDSVDAEEAFNAFEVLDSLTNPRLSPRVQESLERAADEVQKNVFAMITLSTYLHSLGIKTDADPANKPVSVIKVQESISDLKPYSSPYSPKNLEMAVLLGQIVNHSPDESVREHAKEKLQLFVAVIRSL